MVDIARRALAARRGDILRTAESYVEALPRPVMAPEAEVLPNGQTVNLEVMVEAPFRDRDINHRKQFEHRHKLHREAVLGLGQHDARRIAVIRLRDIELEHHRARGVIAPVKHQAALAIRELRIGSARIAARRRRAGRGTGGSCGQQEEGIQVVNAGVRCSSHLSGTAKLKKNKALQRAPE